MTDDVKQELERLFTLIDPGKLLKRAFLKGFDTWEDYEKYGDAFVSIKMTRYTFPDAVEASAFTVAMCQMVGKEYLDNIQGMDDGSYVVTLTKPLPEPWDKALVMAIKHDQQVNPAKWEKARANLENKKNDSDQQHPVDDGTA